jgi:hypothetical protein
MWSEVAASRAAPLLEDGVAPSRMRRVREHGPTATAAVLLFFSAAFMLLLWVAPSATPWEPQESSLVAPSPLLSAAVQKSGRVHAIRLRKERSPRHSLQDLHPDTVLTLLPNVPAVDACTAACQSSATGSSVTGGAPRPLPKVALKDFMNAQCACQRAARIKARLPQQGGQQCGNSAAAIASLEPMRSPWPLTVRVRRPP